MMKPLLLTVLFFAILCASCSGQPQAMEPPLLSASLDEALPLAAADDSSIPRWPQFLLPVGDGLLWPERSHLLRVEEVDGQLMVRGPAMTEMTLGLDRLIAGARGPLGEIALLDSSGRVSIRDQGGRLSGFTMDLGQRAAGIAVADRTVFLLLQGGTEGGPAVLGFSFEGAEEGRWGQMPADGLVQGILQGGGLAACSDGNVYFSYINSARLSRLAEDGLVELIGEPPPSFTELRPREIREAFHEAEREQSTKPLVRLGLGASRVMALHCSSENLVFRQVTGPDEGSKRIEVWHPASEELVGFVPPVEGVLFASSGGALYLGALAEEQFELRKYRYDPDRMRSARSR